MTYEGVAPSTANALTRWDRLFFFPLLAMCLLGMAHAMIQFGSFIYWAHLGLFTGDPEWYISASYKTIPEWMLLVMMPSIVISSGLTLAMLRFSDRWTVFSPLLSAITVICLVTPFLFEYQDRYIVFYLVPLLCGLSAMGTKAFASRYLSRVPDVRLIYPLFLVSLLATVGDQLDIIGLWVYKMGPSFRESGPFMEPQEWFLDVILPAVVASFLLAAITLRFAPRLFLLTVVILALLIALQVTSFHPQLFPLPDILCLAAISLGSCVAGSFAAWRTLGRRFA